MDTSLASRVTVVSEPTMLNQHHVVIQVSQMASGHAASTRDCHQRWSTHLPEQGCPTSQAPPTGRWISIIKLSLSLSLVRFSWIIMALKTALSAMRWTSLSSPRYIRNRIHLYSFWFLVKALTHGWYLESRRLSKPSRTRGWQRHQTCRGTSLTGSEAWLRCSTPGVALIVSWKLVEEGEEVNLRAVVDTHRHFVTGPIEWTLVSAMYGIETYMREDVNIVMHW